MVAEEDSNLNLYSHDGGTRFELSPYEAFANFASQRPSNSLTEI